jgi:hypothetical protein
MMVIASASAVLDFLALTDLAGCVNQYSLSLSSESHSELWVSTFVFNGGGAGGVSTDSPVALSLIDLAACA